MAIVKVVNNNTGEVQEWTTDEEVRSEVQQERQPRKAGKKAPANKQAES